MNAAVNQAPWDHLHTLRRHSLDYPAESVVRFLVSAHKHGGARTVLDIGCGAGRHMKLAREIGMAAVGVDFSEEALEQARRYGHAYLADMTRLPFEDDTFDTVVCFGTIYYGTQQTTRDTAREIRRVLRPGGHVCLTLRTERDWHFKHGAPIGDPDEHTIRFELEDEPETGMLMNWADEAEIRWLGDLFDPTYVLVEFVERNIVYKRRLESDWLVTLRKPKP